MELPIRYGQKSFCHEGGQTLEKVPKGLVGSLSFNDIQSLTEQCPRQLKLALL